MPDRCTHCKQPIVGMAYTGGASGRVGRFHYQCLHHPETATISGMPNKPKTPVSGFRIPLDLKEAAQAKAAEEGRTLSDVVNESLTRYVKAKPRKKP